MADVAHEAEHVGQQDTGTARRFENSGQFTHALQRVVIMFQAADAREIVNRFRRQRDALTIADNPTGLRRSRGAQLQPFEGEIEADGMHALPCRQFDQATIAAGYVQQRTARLRRQQLDEPQIERIPHQQIALLIHVIVGVLDGLAVVYGAMANFQHRGYLQKIDNAE